MTPEVQGPRVPAAGRGVRTPARSAQPHSVLDLNDRLREGPHVALSFLRVNGYAAEGERTFFIAAPSPEDRRAFGAMERAREIAFGMIRPGVACGELDWPSTNS
jgi:Xaa-Pro dipeptidase